MTDQQTPVMEQTVQPGSPAPAAPKGPKKKKRRGKGKLIAGILVTAAVVVAVAVILWYFVFRETDQQGEVMTGTVEYGSIQSTVEGSGTTKARNSASVTPGTGTILELYVQEGDQVEAGQQLYKMDDTAAREAVTAAQESVDNAQKDLQAVYDKIAELTVKAPHSGNLREVADLKVGDTVNEGDTIATIVNDTKLRLSLYYSYAYEDQIKVGQTAQVSIPAIMDSRTGTVEKINKVRFVSPEGATHFEVVFVLDNPGTLTEGMEASAGLTASDGTPIYPYQNGKLEFYETTVVKAKASGPVEQFNLMNYGDVKAGQTMVQLGAKNTDEEIASKEEALKAAQEKLKTANDELAKYNATSPIAGTVLSCSLQEGAEVQSGQGISIADTTQMVVEITVDERNARYVKAGMMVNIDQYGTPYMGIVESVSMTASGENGVASVPAVVTVDNFDGSMIPGTYVSYSFVASESDNCLVVPIQAVKYVSFDNVTLPDTLDAAPSEGGDMGGMIDGEMLPEDGMTDGEMLPEDGMIEGEMLPADDGTVISDGSMAVPQRYSGGAFAKPLMSVAIPGGGVVVGGGSMDGSMGGTGSTDNAIVWVQSDEPPVNAILEPDPSWEQPKGFWAVPVTVGLNDNSQVEIVRGLSQGQVIFLGYQNPEQMYY
ncbi:efflux RND transporter periplasmic adaptor subunit [Pseudoflavonifractor phocaeensis]|uniref:efflux RND transporter periplasmic adaptor subunit n=1 Tax=Pseudoflavonifractor phocaeensis TaxID=1870988 RepID=UPI001957AFE2|nr:HlyD family efflux transporter periplasmic adaptor subunit [Pseudoflavonifractor phocaeensis]MBM6885347.1 HlyD family efflux transporter periplasmic adaptor subunit [Pseudoflavonifractor phocaeensis]